MVVNAVFPPRCAGCGRRGVWVCESCDPLLARLAEPLCPRCGVPADMPCRCHELDAGIDRLRSAAWYVGWLRPAIHSFKYEGESARASHLADLLVEPIRAMPAEAVLMPVPLHPTRERARGYNQARLLSEQLGRRTEHTVAHQLVREVATRQQVGLGAAERAANVRNAFNLAAGADCRDRVVVLIDDVCTTGATLGACAACLKAAGAAFVGAATLAREH